MIRETGVYLALKPEGLKLKLPETSSTKLSQSLKMTVREETG